MQETAVLKDREAIQKSVKSERNMGVELFRVVSMLMVVLLLIRIMRHSHWGSSIMV